ncbi:hypothetical protein CWB72_14870 [Pseudoalteromonas phenolica]|uniref:hypothetical protein n=1 Tax=Pseudoalteromonas phenolica TaxID=161398 RepID=UPI00110C1597|nr:hypothetical protein [Pseudoalteromonas phenolica]TMN87561.1 hypothetical protein CWB72_14870 [Pseudoalteromonas phenolica]
MSNTNTPSDANNLFWFLSRVLNDEEFKDKFNQAPDQFLKLAGLNDEQRADLEEIYNIIYKSKESGTELPEEKLALSWQKLIDDNEAAYVEYLTKNFTW